MFIKKWLRNGHWRAAFIVHAHVMIIVIIKDCVILSQGGEARWVQLHRCTAPYAVQVTVVGAGLALAVQTRKASERPTYQLLSYPSMDTDGGSENEKKREKERERELIQDTIFVMLVYFISWQRSEEKKEVMDLRFIKIVWHVRILYCVVQNLIMSSLLSSILQIQVFVNPLVFLNILYGFSIL